MAEDNKTRSQSLSELAQDRKLDEDGELVVLRVKQNTCATCDLLRTQLKVVQSAYDTMCEKCATLEDRIKNLENEQKQDRKDLNILLRKERKLVLGELLNTLFELLAKFTKIDKETLQESKTFVDLKEKLDGTSAIKYLGEIRDNSSLMQQLRGTRNPIAHPNLFDYEKEDLENYANKFFQQKNLRKDCYSLIEAIFNLKEVTSE